MFNTFSGDWTFPSTWVICHSSYVNQLYVSKGSYWLCYALTNHSGVSYFCFKCIQNTKPCLIFLLSGTLTLSKMCKPREIFNFDQGNGPFHSNAFQLHHFHFKPCTKFLGNTGNTWWTSEREEGSSWATILFTRFAIAQSGWR